MTTNQALKLKNHNIIFQNIQYILVLSTTNQLYEQLHSIQFKLLQIVKLHQNYKTKMSFLQKVINFKNLLSLPPETQIKYFKLIFFITLAIITFMNFCSLSLTGSNFMIWKNMQTHSIEQQMNARHKNFFVSQQLIIAFDVLCLGILGLLSFSVFKFYTKGNLIIIGNKFLNGVISSLFWIVRWSSSIFFLITDSQIRQENQKKYSLIFDENKELNSLCLSQSCSGQLLNYVECGKILIWKQLQNFQTGYLVITIVLGILLMLVAYKTNELDVKSQSSEAELAEIN